MTHQIGKLRPLNAKADSAGRRILLSAETCKSLSEADQSVGFQKKKRRKLCHIVVFRCKGPASVHNVYKEGYYIKDACSSDFIICPMPQWTTCKLHAHGGHDSIKIACVKCILKCGMAVCHPKASVTYLQGCLPLSEVLPLVDYFSQSKIAILLVGSWYWQTEQLACRLASVLGFKFHHRGEKVTTKCLSESTLWIDAFSRRQWRKGHRSSSWAARCRSTWEGGHLSVCADTRHLEGQFT